MDDILKFASHPALNKSWLADALWGGRTSSQTGKITMKLQGKRSWQPEELTRLQDIRKDFILQILGMDQTSLKKNKEIEEAVEKMVRATGMKRSDVEKWVRENMLKSRGEEDYGLAS